MVRKPGRLLRLLSGVLDGRPPPEDAWPGVLETANRGWLAPALYLALERSGALGEVPQPVRDYLSLLHERNRERNRRLRAQLVEATTALNGRGIQPVLLKGAANLFTAEPHDLGARMISDIDVSIAPSEMADARAALLALGYAETASERELARPTDVGMIELHPAPSARSARYLSGDVRLSSRPVRYEGATALIPSPTARALHLIVHDMIKQGDYWRLRMDLRHVKDLADLAKSAEGVDWKQLSEVLSDRTGQRALGVQLQSLEDLFGVPVEREQLQSRRAKLIHLARLIAIGRSAAAAPVRALGNLSWGLHRLSNDYSWEGTADLGRRARHLFVAPTKGSRL
jgi:hypothetical protein